jgi:hypothetical protein
MIELIKEDLGIIAGLLIVLCQLSLGMFLERKLKMGLSFVAQWVVGVALLALLNFFFLLFDMGTLIHLNCLCLFLLRYSAIKEKLRDMKSMRLTLFFVALLLLFSNVFNPVIDWDAQVTYLYHARHWQQVNGLDHVGLLDLFDLRAQAVSVIYTWGLMWGNETSCQFLDLMFFLGFVAWFGQRFELNSLKLSLVFLMSTAFGILLLWDFTAVAGNDIIVYLFLVVLIEMLPLMRSEKTSWGLILSWLVVGIVFVNIRWNAIPFYAILFPLFFRGAQRKTMFVPTYLLVPLLGCGWYVWNFVVHGNPVYPCAANVFNNVPTNAYMSFDFSSAGMRNIEVEGVRNLSELMAYFNRVGFVLLLFPLSLFVKIERPYRDLFYMAWAAGLLSMLITVQIKFQCFSLLILACLVLVGRARTERREVVKYLFVTMLCVTALPYLGGKIFDAYSLVRDTRHGEEYLLENRIRLYPAARYLNQEGEEGELVIWPMNPHYYCRLPSRHADNVAYHLPDEILGQPAKVSDYLIDNMKAKWIVKAKPYYASKTQAARAMIRYVDWICEHDDRWKLVKKIKATGVSPDIEIYALKRDQKP